MELQWPLIIFTSLLVWSIGIFAAQCACALKGIAPRAQVPAWICSAVLLVASGIAVFMHLEHWERIFNGFGNATSGITQELIAIVALGIVAIVYLVLARKSEGRPPAWVAIVGIVMAVVLVVVCGHSYMMAARPAWNSPIEILSLLGGACALGGATMLVLAAKFSDADEVIALVDKGAVVGTAINVATTVLFIIAMSLAGGSAEFVGFSFDPVDPTAGLIDASAYGPFAGGSIVLTIVAVLGAAGALGAVLLGHRKKKPIVFGAVAVGCALIGAVCLRTVFYQMGFSTFLLF